ncbi:MAG: hypothetical protein ABI166_15915 [Mucilaginibacter sp.]
MKKIILTAAIFLSCLSFNLTHAQIRFSVGVNIGSQPEWGPVGYTHADYYYMPDVDAYYDVSAHQYIYLNNNIWIRGGTLPERYRDYDVYHGYKVVVNRPNPWRYNNNYRTKYARYKGRHDQPVIRDSRDDRYKNHWHDNGNHNGQGNNHGNDRGGNHGDKGHGDKGHGGDHGHGHDH